MSGTTSVPRPVFTDKGFQVQPQSKILAGVLADLQAAFGGNLNPALETPQGQIASTETAIIWDTQMAFSLLTQNVDPAYSSGRMQDGIGRIYFMQRYPARPTTVQATCRGLQGVNIPAGVLAKAIDGNFYTATAAGTIGADGTVVIPFQCNTTGPIACPAGALNQVYQVIPGWDSITNCRRRARRRMSRAAPRLNCAGSIRWRAIRRACWHRCKAPCWSSPMCWTPTPPRTTSTPASPMTASR